MADSVRDEGKLERFIEGLIFSSRWILVPIYLGMILALVFFVAKFLFGVAKVYTGILDMTSSEAILMMLAFIDKLLVANLVIIVIISGYENTVSPINQAKVKKELAWMGKLDAGSLKKKLAISMVSISSVNLLSAFMNVDKTTDRDLWWLIGIHGVFVISALLLAFIDKMEDKKK